MHDIHFKLIKAIIQCYTPFSYRGRTSENRNENEASKSGSKYHQYNASFNNKLSLKTTEQKTNNKTKYCNERILKYITTNNH